MKSILIIDTPKDCPECPCFRAENDFPTYYGEFCSAIGKGLIGGKPEWCPLKPLPEPKEITIEWPEGEYENGWNDCLKEIEK